MSTAVLIAGLASVSILAFVVWLVLIETSIRVEPGTLALLLRRGAATSRALGPGRHFIQPWRKAMVQIYPSRELALLAGGAASGDTSVDATDAPLRLHLGDRTFTELSYTVRCQLDPAKLKDVHNQFGPDGIWSALRDTTRRCIIAEAGDSTISIDDAFGDKFGAFEQRLGAALATALDDIGFELKMFSLREINLGETGEVIQSTLRAAAELERETALIAVRTARLQNDAALGELVADFDGDLMLRYRQIEALGEILQRWGGDRPVPAVLTTPLSMTGGSSVATSSGGDGPDVQIGTEAHDEAAEPQP
jgi:regulator of protease activity HflC (stomatin/prohibitin superfamily)